MSCVGIMLVFFKEEWEMEGLQTVGILLVVCSSLRLMHFLGLIVIAGAGKKINMRSTKHIIKSKLFCFSVSAFNVKKISIKGNTLIREKGKKVEIVIRLSIQ